jgi:endonuclease YncB( thermonuclease family)
MFEYRATIERAIDGDTFVAMVDLGFGIFKRETFRVAGIDCPELNTMEGKAAKAFVEDWLASTHGVVSIESKKPDKYGRWLAIVYKDRNEPSLSAALLNRGLAKTYDGGHRE